MMVTRPGSLRRTTAGGQIFNFSKLTTKKKQCKSNGAPAQDVGEGTLEQQQRDAILLCKFDMNSKELSQQPLLLLPSARLAALQSQTGPTSALARNPLKAEELKHFRKTASVIEQPPWAMHDGSNYLRSLCDRSERADFPSPARLGLYTLRQHEVALHSAPGEVAWKDFAPERPKEVFVCHAKQKEGNSEGPGEMERKRAVLNQATPQAAKRHCRPDGAELPHPPVLAQEPANVAVQPANPPDYPVVPAEASQAAESAPPAVQAAAPKAKSKAVAKPKAKVKAAAAAPKPKPAPKAKAAAVPALPQYGCKKCYFKNGCQKCGNFRPGYPKPWRGKARPGDTV